MTFNRIEVADTPGEPARVVLTGTEGAEAACEIDPASAVALAADLLETARLGPGRAKGRVWGGGLEPIGDVVGRIVAALEAER